VKLVFEVVDVLGPGPVDSRDPRGAPLSPGNGGSNGSEPAPAAFCCAGTPSREPNIRRETAEEGRREKRNKMKMGSLAMIAVQLTEAIMFSRHQRH
jgi:hypothetical protein